MIEISLLAAELVFAAVWLLVRAIVWIRRGGVDLKREALLLLMFINLAVIIRFVFFPMERVGGRVQPLVFDPAAAYPFRVNLVPLKNLLRFDTKRDLLLNLVGNSAMFVPTGIVLPIVYGRLRGFWKTVGAGALISLCIELLQLPFAVRASDADDLILNTLGVAVGYGIYALVRGLIRRGRRGKRGGTER
ncbi:MAG: VanZ family protein [Oscillospiraceae bacterium]|nr:VanZ family protein [Oscillospiraceae bacterium]